MQFIDEREERIIRESVTIFMRYGIKSINMDDLATRLGMSKKTLYRYVSDKNDLVARVFAFQMSEEDCQLRSISEKHPNAIDESFEIMHMVMSMIKDLHPSVLFDLQKYHPELMREMECKRNSVVLETLKKNLQKGIAGGYYRADLNIDFISSLYVSAVEGIFHKLSFDQTGLSFQDLYLELFRYHIRGIASERGLAYLVEKVNKERQAKSPQ
jgi:AcrR family transcriptional regulator